MMLRLASAKRGNEREESGGGRATKTIIMSCSKLPMRTVQGESIAYTQSLMDDALVGTIMYAHSAKEAGVRRVDVHVELIELPLIK